MTSALPVPNYECLRLHGAYPAGYGPLQLAQEQQSAARPGWRNDISVQQDCKAEYDACAASGLLPIRQCIQAFYGCMGITFP